MITVLSLVTSVKDYIEIAHKFVETQNTAGINSSQGLFGLTDYTEFGAILTYVVLSLKSLFFSFFSFSWLQNIWNLPLIVPDIASAMISEISVFDSFFTNSFSFLESGLNSSNPIGTASGSAGQTFMYGFEKFIIGFFNSFFLFLPTSTSHLITLRRFVMQGLEAGYIAGLGTIAGNFVWLASIILGLRFIVIPWLSLDIFRYILGFVLLVKYIWDCSNERFLNLKTENQFNKIGNRPVLEDNSSSKRNIFLLNFLLALTEQTSIYPFISNLSFGAQGSILEGFSGSLIDNSFQFFFTHGFYLLGILLGSYSLLQFTVWFWENPAYSIYMWALQQTKSFTSSNTSQQPFRSTSTVAYHKIVNFIFVYLTMLCAFTSIPYFGLDYTVTKPLGLLPQDRILDQKASTAKGPGDVLFPETSFLTKKSTDNNSRYRDGMHARRERWKERLIKYQAFDASLYDSAPYQGVYDILTIEDLNYGFDRFWSRRKLRNHKIGFRLFPGPWMRSLKKQLNKTGSVTGPRSEFFRILFEQYYHPSFHTRSSTNVKTSQKILDNKQNQPLFNVTVAANNYAPTLALNKRFVERDPESSTLSAYASGVASNIQPAKSAVVKKANIFKTQKGLVQQYSALRKFSRRFSTRINSATQASLETLPLASYTNPTTINQPNVIYSKSLKYLYNKINKEYNQQNLNLFRKLSKQYLTQNLLNPKHAKNVDFYHLEEPIWQQDIFSRDKTNKVFTQSLKKTNIRKKLTKKEKLLLTSKIYYTQNLSNPNGLMENSNLQGSQTPGISTKAQSKPSSSFAVFNKSNNPTSIDSLKPLEFYLQKDEAFKRKLKYYSSTVTRKLSVGNNAPYFKTMLKKAFYYHKPNQRWRRTIFVAAMRRGFRKKATYPKKIVYTTSSLTKTSKDGDYAYERDSQQQQLLNGIGVVEPNTNLISPSTTSYSILGKRASRYRYQIYKDVLQHWYYTPFNRLLLKFDVDSFINRQPKTQFLTKQEERLLHLRRVLLSEHYNTLRWYTYMQHYRTMKSRIGGTKSFANTVYNQQFQGTFKKIRHLFSITPSQGDMTILKFDQILYNDRNISLLGKPDEQIRSLKEKQGVSKNKKSLNNLLPYYHEGLSSLVLTNRYSSVALESREALPDQVAGQQTVTEPTSKPQDLVEQSLSVAGQYLKNEKQEYNFKIKEYIKQQNYAGLTSLLANNSSAYSQSINTQRSGVMQTEEKVPASTLSNNSSEKILLELLKACKHRLNNSAFLKNYVTHRLEKRSSVAQSQQDNLNVENLQGWLSPIVNIKGQLVPDTTTSGEATNTPFATGVNPQSFNVVTTTGLRKALDNGIASLETANSNTLNRDALQNLEILALQQAAQQEQIKQTLNTIDSLTTTLNKKGNKVVAKQNIKNQIATTTNKIVNGVLKPLFNFTYTKYKLLTKRTEQNLIGWRKKETMLSKRVKARKKDRIKTVLDLLRAREQLKEQLFATNGFDNTQLNNSSVLNYAFGRDDIYKIRKKVDSSVVQSLDTKTSSLTKQKLDIQNIGNQKTKVTKYLEKLFVKKFRRKTVANDRHFRPFVLNRGYAHIRRQKPPSNYIATQKTLFSSKQSIYSNFVNPPEIQNNQKQDSGSIFGRIAEIKNLFNQGYLKRLPIKKRTKRSWKKRKRQKFMRDHFRYRKRDSYSFGKLRSVAKKLIRLEYMQELQNWWWNNYLPNWLQNFDGSLLNKNITNTNSSKLFAKPNVSEFFKGTLGVFAKGGDKALAQAQTLNGSAQLAQQSSLVGLSNSITQSNTNIQTATTVASEKQTLNKVGFSTDAQNQSNVLDKIYNNLFISSNSALATDSGMQTPDQTGSLSTTNISTSIPFYAGWDESLRKFVVTNRLLSRREAGSEVSLSSITKAIFGTKQVSAISRDGDTASTLATETTNSVNSKISFTNAPIKGLNEGSFLYLQLQGPVAFSAYAIDQFVPNNQSFYAPLGWNRFQFRSTINTSQQYSILKNWFQHRNKATDTGNANKGAQRVYNPANVSISNGDAINNSFAFIKSASLSNFKFFKEKPTISLQFNKTQALLQRRIVKRYKMLKQTAIQLMYLPTGALLTEVLPSHYISVFDKQNRFPRFRYLKRYLPQTTNSIQTSIRDLTLLEKSNAEFNRFDNTKGIANTNNISLDFTLRKRIKPKRKYHKKRFIRDKKEGLIFPRRRKFGTFDLNLDQNNLANSELLNQSESLFRLRPSSKTTQTTQSNTKTQKRAGQSKTNPARVRQLRRREFQQLIRPSLRLNPRYGGLVWAGDYLRFEIVPMPKLTSQPLSPINKDLAGPDQVSSAQLTTKVQRKINVPPVGGIPRKYLIQKHNLKVLKKKLALSQL
jgi:hypothetical protein